METFLVSGLLHYHFLMNLKVSISNLSNKLTTIAGSAWTVAGSLLSIIIFLLLGFLFKWSDTYILVFNTFMSVVAYWMLFILQHSSNKDIYVLQKKLDELIRAIDKADNKFIKYEEKVSDTNNLV
jgi:low affinity Fe/Cu permease